MTDSSELVRIGKITGTHGIRGMVKVYLYAGDDSSLAVVTDLVIDCADGRRQTVVATGVQSHGRKTLVTLEGYGAINDVLPLVGGELLIRRDQLPEPDEGEFYWEDLIGLRVRTVDGINLGTLSEIMETGSNDVYVVRDAGRELLLPATEEVVQEIDLEAGTMTVALLDGMLDL